MNKAWLLVLAAPLMLSLAACYHEGYGVKNLQSSQLEDSLRLQRAITYSCEAGSEKGVSGLCPDNMKVRDDPSAPEYRVALVDISCFQANVSDGEKIKCQQQRNSAVWVLMTASNNMCQDHLKSIYGNESTSNFALGSLATLFSGAASVTSPVSVSKVLAALGSFSSAERSLVNDVFYKDRLISAITAKISQGRELLGRELAGHQTKTIESYGMRAVGRNSSEGRRAELFRGSAACHTCHVDPDEYRARVISLGPSM